MVGPIGRVSIAGMAESTVGVVILTGPTRVLELTISEVARGGTVLFRTDGLIFFAVFEIVVGVVASV